MSNCAMFKATFKETTALKASFKESEDFSVSFGEGIPIYPEAYSGAVTITPSSSTQTIETAGLYMPKNITINPVPSNYGLITWNGSTITVS